MAAKTKTRNCWINARNGTQELNINELLWTVGYIWDWMGIIREFKWYSGAVAHWDQQPETATGQNTQGIQEIGKINDDYALVEALLSKGISRTEAPYGQYQWSYFLSANRTGIV